MYAVAMPVTVFVAPGTRCYKRYADFSRCAGISVRRVDCRLFVADNDLLQIGVW